VLSSKHAPKLKKKKKKKKEKHEYVLSRIMNREGKNFEVKSAEEAKDGPVQIPLRAAQPK